MKMSFPWLFTLFPGNGAVGCMVMTDGLGQSKEMNLMLAKECPTHLYGYIPRESSESSSFQKNKRENVSLGYKFKFQH